MPNRRSESPSPGVFHLLEPSWLRVRRASSQQRTVRLVFLLLGVGIAAGIYAISAWFLGLCYAIETVGPLLCRVLLDIVLSVFLGVLLLSNVVTALSTFFLADDLQQMMVAPLRSSALFGARFIQQLFHSSAMVLIFGLPVLLAFAKAAGGPFTWLAIAGALPPLLIMPGAIATAVVLMLVTVLPAGRLRAIVMALMVVAFVVFYLALRLMQPERLLNPAGFATVVELLRSMSANTSGLLPWHWGTAVIAASFQDGTREGWMASLAALWIGAAVTYLLGLALFRRLYPTAFSNSLQSRNVARISRFWSWLRRAPLPPASGLGTPGRHSPGRDWIRALGVLGMPGVHREMLIKDAKLLLRDASQWSQLVLLLALIFVYLYNFRFFRRIGDSGMLSQLATYIMGLGLAGFVTTAMSVRFAFPLVSLEGRVLWLLRSAPVEPRQLLMGKLLATLPPLLLVSEALTIASAMILGVPTSLVLFGALFSALTTLAVGSLSVGLGALFPDFGAESAAKVASSFGGLICMTVAMLAGLTLTAFSVYPAILLYRRAWLVMHWGGLMCCGAGLLATTALCCVLPMQLGARSLSRLES